MLNGTGAWFESRLLYHRLYSIDTVYPKKYAHGFVVLCFVVVMQLFIMNSHEVFIHIHQCCFAGTGAIVRLPQCQWSKPDGYGKISQCITTVKHNKAKTVCIFLGIYCTQLHPVMFLHGRLRQWWHGTVKLSKGTKITERKRALVNHIFRFSMDNAVIMSAMASQITSLTIVYLTVYSRRRSRTRQSSASLALVRGMHRWPVNSPHKGPVTRKMFPFDDVIMDKWMCGEARHECEVRRTELKNSKPRMNVHSDIYIKDVPAWKHLSCYILQ